MPSATAKVLASMIAAGVGIIGLIPDTAGDPRGTPAGFVPDAAAGAG